MDLVFTPRAPQRFLNVPHHLKIGCFSVHLHGPGGNFPHLNPKLWLGSDRRAFPRVPSWGVVVNELAVAGAPPFAADCPPGPSREEHNDGNRSPKVGARYRSGRIDQQ